MIRKLRLSFALLISCFALNAYAASDLSQLANFYQHSSELMTSGQPRREQFKAIADAGVKVVINLSSKRESTAIADEERIVTGLGMRYENIPVSWSRPKSDNLRRLISVLQASNGVPVLVHCASNARASAFVYLSRVFNGEDAEREREILDDIWRTNIGVTLSMVSQWRRFVARALAMEPVKN